LQSYNEEDIVTGNENVPELWYETDKRHRHYVDFYIPKENVCIEIKSEWTLQSKKDNIFIKQAAAKEAGYKYEIWVYDAEGHKTRIYS
jgi:predicted AAA+ superfamily ATPase